MASTLINFICYSEAIEVIEFKSSRAKRVGCFPGKNCENSIPFISKRSHHSDKECPESARYQKSLKITDAIVQTNYNTLQLICSSQDIRARAETRFIGDSDCFIFKKLDRPSL